MRSLYPAIEPYKTHRLQVNEVHNLYIEEAGNPLGQPVVFLHGGPGGGVSPEHRSFFDPKHYRIVLFDQRGSGKSTPSADLRENTTWDLVRDIERIRAMLGIEKWLVFGGSWGSTLALSYAITHPDRVKGLVLRGIFLCRRSELLWFYQEGASHLFPEAWDKYLEPIAEHERLDLISAYYRQLTSTNAEIRLRAAKAWSKWEAATSRLIPSQDAIDDFDDPEYALSFARIECHYFINGAFFPSDNYLLENISKIRHIPCSIVQGRYDVVCPARSAWDLKKAWPEANLTVIANAGHAAGEEGTRSRLVEITDEYRKL